MSPRVPFPYEDAAELALLGGRDPQCGYVLDHEAAQLGDLGCAGGCGGGCGAKRGCGCGGQLGAVELEDGGDFDPDAVWADAKAGGAPYTPGTAEYKLCASDYEADKQACALAKGQANFRGARATAKIRAALNDLGYGPLEQGGAWTQANPGNAVAAFRKDHGITPAPGLIDKATIDAMAVELGGDGGGGENDLPVPKKSLWPWIIGGLAVAGTATATYFLMK